MRRANFALPLLVLVLSGLVAASLVMAIGARDDLGQLGDHQEAPSGAAMTLRTTSTSAISMGPPSLPVMRLSWTERPNSTG